MLKRRVTGVIKKIVPENRYVYDSLYQLVSATGRESANQQTPASMQSSACDNVSQRYAKLY
ncbi:hypothetical protein [Proteus penneri]|uniref:hypothetical protein n=1 Tax=Proteus penneri TaxID=102862 RepID=UPI0011C04254|nr:hypothetical protein [Proteus penneri]